MPLKKWQLAPDISGRMGEFHIKRIVLPSGKTVEIVYYQASGGGDPVISNVHEIEHGAGFEVRQLEVCGGCGGDRVHPTEWDEVEEMRWQLALRCPDCEAVRSGVFDQDSVEAFDEILDAGTDSLSADYRKLMRANMAEEIDRFAAALGADAILPEDF